MDRLNRVDKDKGDEQNSDRIELPDFYLSQGLITGPGEFSHLFRVLPDSLSEIIEVIHGLFLHIFWAEEYGVALSGEEKAGVQLRWVEAMLERLISLEDSPLNQKREYHQRLIGNCRDHAVFLTSVLRAKGIPARARCGFARYFTPGRFEDHWICEYWDGEEEKWQGVDPQLDRLQRDKLGISFDPLAVPDREFVSGAEAWNMARSGREDPDKFGIFDMHGLWFIRGNLMRDLASLNKLELLPWDCWGLSDRDEQDLTESEFNLLDRAARLIEEEDDALYTVYRENELLRVPAVINSYTADGVKQARIYQGESKKWQQS